MTHAVCRASLEAVTDTPNPQPTECSISLTTDIASSVELELTKEVELGAHQLGRVGAISKLEDAFIGGTP
ncbi:MAG TPA: hypothetical protein VID48_03875 [Solirubrobacteraceae bacterium]|jgi:hypothetical protein